MKIIIPEITIVLESKEDRKHLCAMANIVCEMLYRTTREEIADSIFVRNGLGPDMSDIKAMVKWVETLRTALPE